VTLAKLNKPKTKKEPEVKPAGENAPGTPSVAPVEQS